LGELEVVVVFDGALGRERAGVTEGVGEGGEVDWGPGAEGGDCGGPVDEGVFRVGLGAWGVW